MIKTCLLLSRLGIVGMSLALAARAQTAQPLFPGEQLSLWQPRGSSWDDFRAVPALADIDGDGILDLAMTYGLMDEIHLFRGDGLGGFAALSVLDVGLWCFALRMQDLDADGHADLVAVNPRGPGPFPYLEVARGLGQGQFAAFSQSIMMTQSAWDDVQLELADLNHDGVLDALVSPGVYSASAVDVFLGNGLGGFATPLAVAIGSGPVSLAVADFNGDTHTDLAATCRQDGEVRLALGDGLGGFGAPVAAIRGLAGPTTVGAGDFDGDGDVDLASGDDLSPSIDPRLALALNQGNGTFVTEWRTYPALNLYGFCGPAKVADFDGDGRTDLALAVRTKPGGLFTLRGVVGGSLGPARLSLSGDFRPYHDAVGDLDRDGTADIVLGAGFQSVSIFLGGRARGLRMQEFRATGSSPSDLALADFDGNGSLDVAAACSQIDGLSLHLGDGLGGLQRGTHLPCADGTGYVADGDIDNDGDLDLVAANFYANSISVLRNDGAGSFAPAFHFPVGVNSSDLALGDVTGDGKLDAILTHDVGPMEILVGDGLGGFGSAYTLPCALQARSLVARDLDGDGDLDLAASHSSGGSVCVHANQGGGLFAAEFLVPVGDFSQALAVGDLDGNGMLDLVTCNFSGPGRVSVMLATAALSYGPASSAVAGAGARDIALGDFDGDGRLDVALSHNGGSSSGGSLGGLCVLRNLGGGALADSGRSFGVGGGQGVLRAGDFDRDGRQDLVFAGRDGVPRIGVLLNQRASSTATAYCSAKLNALGCAPAISASGVSSASAAHGFIVAGTDVRNRQPGLLFYGTSGRAALPFQGGILCVSAPIRRTVVRGSGGTPAPANDCTGAYVIDFNAFAAGQLGGNPQPQLSQPGTLVDAQWWGRDPGYPVPNNSSLSNAIEFVIGS